MSDQGFAPNELQRPQLRKSFRGSLDGATDRFEVGWIVVYQHHRGDQGCTGDNAVESPTGQALLTGFGQLMSSPRRSGRLRQEGHNFRGDHPNCGVHRPNVSQVSEISGPGGLNGSLTLDRGTPRDYGVSSNPLQNSNRRNMHWIER